MKVLLIGTYDLGYQALAALLGQGIRVVGVVTKPGGEESQKNLLNLILAAGLPLRLPASPAAPGLAEWIRALGTDLIAVAGYPHRSPRDLLRLPPRGCINTHLSLLPRYRGPCPWKWARVHGERTTGVTVHVMSARFDQGPILAQREFAIAEEETGGSLFHHLSILGAHVLTETIVDLDARQGSAIVQDELAATHQGPPTDHDTRIRWGLGSKEILDLIRGFSPRPGAWTTYLGRRIRIRNASWGGPGTSTPAGRILSLTGEGLRVATGDGLLDLREITSEGVVAKGPGGETPLAFQAGSAFDEETVAASPGTRRGW